MGYLGHLILACVTVHRKHTHVHILYMYNQNVSDLENWRFLQCSRKKLHWGKNDLCLITPAVFPSSFHVWNLFSNPLWYIQNE